MYVEREIHFKICIYFNEGNFSDIMKQNSYSGNLADMQMADERTVGLAPDLNDWDGDGNPAHDGGVLHNEVLPGHVAVLVPQHKHDQLHENM